MNNIGSIPLKVIENSGLVSKLFLNVGISNFYDAISWVYHLPYGRNSNRSNYHLIFEEQKGTPSTKHAAIVALAIEQNIAVKLKMVICKLDKTLVPNVHPLLDRIGVDFLPEAHCYISLPKVDLDISFPDQTPFLKVVVLKEYEILPSEIGERKLELHKEYLKEWMSQVDLKEKISFDELWLIREEWIRSLSDRA